MAEFTFSYVPTRREFPPQAFAPLQQSHRHIQALAGRKLWTRLARFQRAALMAGVALGVSYVFPFQKPDLELGRTEINRQAGIAKGNTKAPPPAAAAGGPSGGGKAAAGGKGIGAAFKSALSSLAKVLSGPAPSSSRTSPHDDWDSEDSITMARYHAEAPRPSLSGSSADFLRSKNLA